MKNAHLIVFVAVVAVFVILTPAELRNDPRVYGPVIALDVLGLVYLRVDYVRWKRAMRRKLDDFSGCLAVAIELQDRPPIVVLGDLMVYAWELWDALDRHAHAETEAIHECLKRHLRQSGERGK